jgi:hypothetical protein
LGCVAGSIGHVEAAAARNPEGVSVDVELMWIGGGGKSPLAPEAGELAGDKGLPENDGGLVCAARAASLEVVAFSR